MLKIFASIFIHISGLFPKSELFFYSFCLFMLVFCLRFVGSNDYWITPMNVPKTEWPGWRGSSKMVKTEWVCVCCASTVSCESTVLCVILVSCLLLLSLSSSAYVFISLGVIHFIYACALCRQQATKPVSAKSVINFRCYQIFYRLIKKMCAHIQPNSDISLET